MWLSWGFDNNVAPRPHLTPTCSDFARARLRNGWVIKQKYTRVGPEKGTFGKPNQRVTEKRICTIFARIRQKHT